MRKRLDSPIEKRVNQVIKQVEKHQTVSTSTHSFFQKLKLPNLKLDSFLATQQCFAVCVKYWTEALTLLLTKTPLSNIQARLVLVENLYDELGDGKVEDAHVNTFSRYCSLLESKLKDQDQKHKKDKFSNEKSKLACLAFNETLGHFIQTREWYESFACLGAIEYVYSQIASKIHHVVHLRFQIPQEEIPHYKMHEKLDVEHARELWIPVIDFLQTSSSFLQLEHFQELHGRIQRALLDGVQLIESVFLRMSEDLDVHVQCSRL